MIPVPKFIGMADPTREAGSDFGEECEADVARDPAAIAAFRSVPDVLRERRPRAPIPTGISELDKLTGGGLSRGDSAIFGSGPGGLKTTLLVNIVETMASPETAICFVAWDERWTTVAAKLGARFGEPYAELDAEHPAVLDSLAARIKGRGAFVRFVDPASALTVEDLAANFDSLAPPGRLRIYVVDLLQLMESKTFGDKDTEVIELKKIVEALLRVNRGQDSILLVASEATKSAISLEAVEANPLAVFAGSRKMASRFDLPVAMAKTDAATVKVFVAKNRLGPAGTFLIRLDHVTWRVESLGAGDVQAEADSAHIRKRKALGREVLNVLPPADQRGLSRRRIADSLKARTVHFGNGELGPAIELLEGAGLVVQDDGPRGSLLAKLAIGIDPDSPQVKAW